RFARNRALTMAWCASASALRNWMTCARICNKRWREKPFRAAHEVSGGSSMERFNMATRVRWLGHSCLLLESDGKRLLVDPFLTGNPAAAVKADEVQADFILVSHGHADHV